MQFEAKTVEEATKNGLETLGITEEQAKITVIEQPVKGLFGRLKGKAVVEIEKIEENMARDKRNNSSLVDLGWCVIRFWEKDVLKSSDACIQNILSQIP